ncbi:MAG: Crp/Fnr family transcriptional regulator, partial [Zunongwangia sp.]|nr:Crp/Fnr family transcriptional regulator [Zunongwangia sp.]
EGFISAKGKKTKILDKRALEDMINGF